ncbi:MAG: hypothetical protein KAI86_17050 [Desulfobacterales bacterium]|nr:hypothetical protein [Desulfobacterales bacterium]
MKKVVRSITVRKLPAEYRLIGYSSSDRGTRIVAGVSEVQREGKTQKEVNEEVKEAITKFLEPQLNTV